MALIEKISKETGFLVTELNRFVRTAPFKYKTYQIPKRTNGFRTISQPSKDVKFFQHLLINLLLKDIPVHAAATAYKKKSGIKNNATVHINNDYLIKLDFKNFFPSIRPDDLLSRLESHIEDKLSELDILFIKNIFFYMNNEENLVLSIGAPSSPIISNIVMYEFDINADQIASSLQSVYSRYADDITISNQSTERLLSTRNQFFKLIEETKSPNLELNDDKTVYASKKNGRRVTGVILTNDYNLSIGRDKKRLIRSMLDHFRKGSLVEEDIAKLQGYLRFANDIEPDFILRMSEKYKNIVNNLISNKIT